MPDGVDKIKRYVVRREWKEQDGKMSKKKAKRKHQGNYVIDEEWTK